MPVLLTGVLPGSKISATTPTASTPSSEQQLNVATAAGGVAAGQDSKGKCKAIADYESDCPTPRPFTVAGQLKTAPPPQNGNTFEEIERSRFAPSSSVVVAPDTPACYKPNLGLITRTSDETIHAQPASRRSYLVPSVT